MADQTWIVYHQARPGEYVRVRAQYWHSARALGAALLGVAVLDGLAVVPESEAHQQAA